MALPLQPDQHPAHSASLHPEPVPRLNLGSGRPVSQAPAPGRERLLPAPPQCLIRLRMGGHLQALVATHVVSHARISNSLLRPKHRRWRAGAVGDGRPPAPDAILPTQNGPSRARTRARDDNPATNHGLRWHLRPTAARPRVPVFDPPGRDPYGGIVGYPVQGNLRCLGRPLGDVQARLVRSFLGPRIGSLGELLRSPILDHQDRMRALAAPRYFRHSPR